MRTSDRQLSPPTTPRTKAKPIHRIRLHRFRKLLHQGLDRTRRFPIHQVVAISSLPIRTSWPSTKLHWTRPPRKNLYFKLSYMRWPHMQPNNWQHLPKPTWPLPGKQFWCANLTLSIVGVQETRHHHLVDINNDYCRCLRTSSLCTKLRWYSALDLQTNPSRPVWNENQQARREDCRHWCQLSRGQDQDWIMAVYCHQSGSLRKAKGRSLPVLDAHHQHPPKERSRPTDLLLQGHKRPPSRTPHWCSWSSEPIRGKSSRTLHHDKFLPATFPSLHPGDEHNTFVTPDGQHETRIDYIAMPRGLPYDSILSKVATEVDLSVHRIDHHASTCAFELQVQEKTSKPTHQRRRGPDLQDLASKLQDNTFFQSHLGVGRHHNKYHYKKLRQLRKTLCFTLLRGCFQGWQYYLDEQYPQRQLVHQANVTDFPGWLRLHDHSVALTLSNLRRVSTEAQKAIRQEDAQYYYYNGLADKAAKTYSVEGLTGIWKGFEPSCQKNESRAPTWLVTSTMNSFDILSNLRLAWESCLQRNNAEQAQGLRQLHLALSELPTLAEAENLCLHQNLAKHQAQTESRQTFVDWRRCYRASDPLSALQIGAIRSGSHPV